MSDEAAAKPKFDPTITLGAVLQISVLLVGFITYLTAGNSRVEQTAEAVKRLEAQVASQAISTRDSMRESVGRVEAVVGALQSQVGQLPTLTERLRQQDDAIKRLAERDDQFQRYVDDRRAILDQRFQALEQRAIESSADRQAIRATLESLTRASAVNLPGQRGVRP